MSKPTNLSCCTRQLSSAGLSTVFAVWVSAVSFLSVERQLRHDVHAKWMIAVRQTINAFFVSEDAFANIEHLLFGLATATLGILIVSIAQSPSQLAPTSSPPRWKAAVRRVVRVVWQKLRSSIPFPLSERDSAKIPKLSSVGMTLRLLVSVAVPASLLTSAWSSWAYGKADVAVIGIVALLSAGATWHPRRTLALANKRPALMAFCLSLPVWLHLEGAWKFERVEHHLNTLAHAARHGALSSGACCATLLAFHLYASKAYPALHQNTPGRQKV